MNDRAQAISFANGYFALVDSLASGFENHLAEDVVLDWFGRTIKGRTQVATFIQRHKVTSRHLYFDIAPVANIGYKASPTHGRTRFHKNDDGGKGDGDGTIDVLSCLDRIIEPKDVEGTKSSDQGGAEQEAMMTDDMTYYLNEGDLNNLFKLEITSTNTEEIEESINRMKLEEEMASCAEGLEGECGQGDGPDVTQSSRAIKYMEARGEIEFSRRGMKRDCWVPYNVVVTGLHRWRRECKLQIAYSVMPRQKTPQVSPAKSQEHVSRSTPDAVPKQNRGKLLSLDEINELSNRIVPNVDSFGGYLRTTDFFEDREDFLQTIESEMADKKTNYPLIVPHYVHNKLLFNRPDGMDEEKHDLQNQKSFVFNYQIHLIIYEGRNKCKVNLMNQFEKQP